MYSSLPIEYCGSYSLEKYPYDPYCDFKIAHNQSDVEIKNAKKVLIAIHNPNNKTVRSTIKYTNKYQCEEKAFGDVWSKNINDSGAKCVKYHIPRKETFELMLSMSNMQYSTTNVSAVLGDEIVDITSEYTIFTKADIEKGCKAGRACDITFVIQQNLNTLIHVVVQYLDKEITLLDGLSQPVYGSYGPSVYSLFKYHIEDKVNTSFMLESKHGFFEFFVNIVNDTDYKLGWSDLFPTRDTHHFSSNASYYSMFNNLLITDVELKNKSCTKCLALISVCLRGESATQEEGQFIVEVSQELHHLTEHKESVGYLEKDSFAYYTYFSPKAGSLFITLTTENKRCANIYLAKGTERRASGSFNLMKSTGNDLFFNCDASMYSITL